MGIGVDQIPVNIKNSKVLSANNLGQLGSTEQLPTPEEIAEYKASQKTKFLSEAEIHAYAKSLLDVNKIAEAWKVLLAN